MRAQRRSSKCALRHLSLRELVQPCAITANGEAIRSLVPIVFVEYVSARRVDGRAEESAVDRVAREAQQPIDREALQQLQETYPPY